MLAFPKFGDTLHVHADSSDTQLGVATSQSGEPVAFCSRRLTLTQQLSNNTLQESAKHH